MRGAAAAWWSFAVLFVGGWALQILGHAAFEGRRPALLDNLFQAFIGPMFITAELMTALGPRRRLPGAAASARDRRRLDRALTSRAAGILIMSATCCGVSGAATNLFFTASASTVSRPRISSGSIVRLGKKVSRPVRIRRSGTLEYSSNIFNAAGSEYIQSTVSR